MPADDARPVSRACLTTSLTTSLTPDTRTIWEPPNTLAIIHVDGRAQPRRRGFVHPAKLRCYRGHPLALVTLISDGGLSCTYEYPRGMQPQRNGSRRCDAILWSIAVGRRSAYFIADLTWRELSAITDLGLSVEQIFELLEVHLPASTDRSARAHRPR